MSLAKLSKTSGMVCELWTKAERQVNGTEMCKGSHSFSHNSIKRMWTVDLWIKLLSVRTNSGLWGISRCRNMSSARFVIREHPEWVAAHPTCYVIWSPCLLLPKPILSSTSTVLQQGTTAPSILSKCLFCRCVLSEMSMAVVRGGARVLARAFNAEVSKFDAVIVQYACEVGMPATPRGFSGLPTRFFIVHPSPFWCKQDKAIRGVRQRCPAPAILVPGRKIIAGGGGDLQCCSKVAHPLHAF